MGGHWLAGWFTMTGLFKYSRAVALGVYALLAASPAAESSVQQPRLRIPVLEGELSANIIDRGTAVPVLVEVRDENDLPVSDALVLFLLRDTETATLDGGRQQVEVTTDAAGQARVSVNPLASGRVELQVTARFAGATASRTIVQNNYQTVADAEAAGETVSDPTATAPTATTTAGGGSGLGTGAIVGIVAAAGGVVAACATGRCGGGDDDYYVPTPSPPPPPPPTVTLVLTPEEISEAEGVSRVTARLSGATSEAVTLTVSASAVSPATSSDFALSLNRELRIGAGQTTSTGTVTVTAVDNGEDHADREVRVTAAVTGASVAAPSARTLTIADDEGAPTVTLVLTPEEISEAEGVSRVTARLSGATSEAVTLTVSASAVSPATSSDFALSLNRELRIGAGQTTSTGTVTVTAVDNGEDHADREVRVTAAVTGASVAAPSARTLTIADDEGAPTVTLVLTPEEISEAEGVSRVTARLSGATSEAVTLTVSASAVSPATSSDFALSLNRELRIGAGQTTSTGTVTVTAVDNGEDHADREVRVTAAVTGASVAAPSARTLTIADDEGAPTVTLVLTPEEISEAEGVSRVTARLSGATSEAVTLTVSASAVSPATSSDFALSLNRELRIGAGQTTSTGTVTVTAVDNGEDHADREVRVTATVRGPSGVAAPLARTLTITDDEEAPEVNLSVSPMRVREDAGKPQVTVTAEFSPPHRFPLDQTVVVEVTMAGNPPFKLSIPGGETQGSLKLNLDLTTLDDNVVRDDRNVPITGRVPGLELKVNPAELTIEDDDEAPEVILSASPPDVREEASATVVTVTAEFSTEKVFPDDRTVTVTVGRPDDTATPDRDYAAVPRSFTITIPALEASGTGEFVLTPIADGQPEDADGEWITVWGDWDVGTTVRPTRVVLIEPDPTSTVTLSVEPFSVSEGESVDVFVTAALSPPRSEETIVTLSLGGTAIREVDYRIDPYRALTIEIPAGATTSSRIRLMGLVALDDAVFDDQETIVLNGTAPGVTVEEDTIQLRDRELIHWNWGAVPDSISEGHDQGSAVALSFDLARPQPRDMTVIVSLQGSAVPYVDYDLEQLEGVSAQGNTLRIVIPANQTNGTGRLVLQALSDGLCEPDETIELSLTTPDHGPFTSVTVLDTTDGCANQEAGGGAAGAAAPRGPAVREPLAPLTLMAGGHVAAVGLAGAFTGDDLTYVIESSDPAVAAVWLAGDAATVASVGEGTATVTVRASNDLGTAVQTFAVMVVTDPAESLAAEAALAAVGRGLLTGIVSTVERRFRGAGEARTVVVAGQPVPLGHARPGGTGFVPLSMLGARSAEDVDAAAADAAMRAAAGQGMVSPSAQRMLPSRGMTVDDLLRGSAFALSLGSGQGAAGEAAPAGGARWTLWGGGDARSFRGAPAGAEYDGDLLTGHLGVDVQRRGWLAGVALSRSAATAGYGFDGVVSGAGALETTLTNVQPYVRWSPRRGTEVWTIAGVGGGSLSNLRPHVADRLETGDLSMRLGVAGVRQALPAVGRVDVAVRGDVGMLRLATGDGTGLIDGLSVDARRLRVGLEASRSVSLGGATLAPFAEVGGRHDGGDGQTGTGLELAGGLRLGALGSRLAVEARGHVLAVHTASGYAERGGSVTATLTPSGQAGGRGLAVTVLPRWGAPGGAGTLWLDDALGRYGMSSGPGSGAGALDTRVAYGFGVGRQVLAPFSEVGRSAGGYRRLRMGAQLLGDGGLRLEVGGERLERGVSGGTADHRFLLVGGMSF